MADFILEAREAVRRGSVAKVCAGNLYGRTGALCEDCGLQGPSNLRV